MPLAITWQSGNRRHNWHVAPAGRDGRVVLYRCAAGAARPRPAQPPLGTFLSVAEASFATRMLDEAALPDRDSPEVAPLRISTQYGDLRLCSEAGSTCLTMEAKACGRVELAKLAHAPPCTIAGMAMHVLRPLALLRSMRVDASPLEPLSQDEIAAGWRR
jgi:hypothetical protein